MKRSFGNMRLGGRYRLSDRIAFGGMGEVWRALDEVLGRKVAVKILRPELAYDDSFRRRFRAEARTAGALSHPGIAAVFDYGEGPVVPADEPVDPRGPRTPGQGALSGDEVAYLVMELVPGDPLSALLSRGALGVDQTLDIVAQSARALHAAHERGVVHRDVKPANLLVTPDGTVKVTDFGIARPRDHEPLTMTGQVMGTAHYLAPELARGREASPLSDVYALGVVMYECLAGRRPFEGDNQVAVATAHLAEPPPPLPDTLPPDVRELVELAMEKDPAQRTPSAAAFAHDLELVLRRRRRPQRPADDGALGDPDALRREVDLRNAAVRAGGTAGAGAAGAAAVPPPPPTAPPAAPPYPPDHFVPGYGHGPTFARDFVGTGQDWSTGTDRTAAYGAPGYPPPNAYPHNGYGGPGNPDGTNTPVTPTWRTDGERDPDGKIALPFGLPPVSPVALGVGALALVVLIGILMVFLLLRGDPPAAPPAAPPATPTSSAPVLLPSVVPTASASVTPTPTRATRTTRRPPSTTRATTVPTPTPTSTPSATSSPSTTKGGTTTKSPTPTPTTATPTPTTATPTPTVTFTVSPSESAAALVAAVPAWEVTR